MRFLILLLLTVLPVMAQTVPLKNPKLQSNMDGGGFMITNVAAVKTASGAPFTTTNDFIYTNLPLGSFVMAGGKVFIPTNASTFTTATILNSTSNSLLSAISTQGAANTNHALAVATVVSNAAVATARTTTNAVQLNGVWYPNLYLASLSATVGDELRCYGNTAITNQVLLPVGAVVSGFGGACLTNMLTNSTALVGTNFTVQNITITSNGAGFFQYHVGSVVPVNGDATCTNLVLRNVKMFGDTDCLIIKQTNYCSVLIEGCTFSSQFDCIFWGSPGLLSARNSKFITTSRSTVGSASVRNVFLNADGAIFENCDFIGNGADLVDGAVYIEKPTHYTPTFSPTNDFYNCRFSTDCTNGMSTNIVNVHGQSLSSYYPLARLYNCTISGGSLTNGVAGIRLWQGGQVELYGCNVLGGATNLQVRIDHSSSYATFSGGGNIQASRIGGSSSTNVRWSQADAGVSASMVPYGWFSNLYADNLASALVTNAPLARSVTHSNIFVSKAFGSDSYVVPGPFLTLTNAQAQAVAGQTIVALDGLFTDTGLGKDGVNWEIRDAATVLGSSSPVWFLGATNSTTNLTVTGSGTFSNLIVGIHYATNCRAVLAGKKWTTSGGALAFFGSGNSNKVYISIADTATGSLCDFDTSLTLEWNTNLVSYLRVSAPLIVGRPTLASEGSSNTVIHVRADEFRASAAGILNVPAKCVFEGGYWSRAGNNQATIGASIWFKGVSCMSSNTDATAAIFTGVHGNFLFENERTLIANP